MNARKLHVEEEHNKTWETVNPDFGQPLQNDTQFQTESHQHKCMSTYTRFYDKNDKI